MTLIFYISRREKSSGNIEYLFLPMERIVTAGSKRPIAPQLPTNTAATLDGTSSTAINFIFDLGSQGVQFQVSGAFLDLDASDIPTVNTGGGERYVIYTSGSIVTSTKPTMSARALRNAWFDFWADLATFNYDTVRLGYPGWFDDGDSRQDTTNIGLGIRQFEGIPSQIQTTQIEGEPNQFAYNFSWTVGNF